MTYDFNNIVRRKGTNCVKYDGMRCDFGADDLIPLWVADMDFAAPDFLRRAVEARAALGIYGYGIRGDDYWNAIIGWEQRRNGWKVDRSWLDFSPGVVAGFSFAIRAFTLAGDGIVIMPPVYPPFAAQIEANDRRVINNPLICRAGHYEIDFDGLNRALEGAAAIMLCNPHNPTGRVFTPEELCRVGELCVRHNVFIISDEIHSDLIQKPYHHTHIAALDERFAARCITFVAPTKTFNIAGLSTSVAIAPAAQVQERFRREMARTHVDQGNVFGTTALTASYSQGDEWLDRLLDYIGGNMRLVCDFFAARLPQVVCRPSEGTYLLWVDFRGLGLTHEELVERMTHSARVALNDGAHFGAEGRGFMRMNVATSRELLLQALERIAEAFS